MNVTFTEEQAARLRDLRDRVAAGLGRYTMSEQDVVWVALHQLSSRFNLGLFPPFEVPEDELIPVAVHVSDAEPARALPINDLPDEPDPDVPDQPAASWDELTVPQLRAEAKARGIELESGYVSKVTLIDALTQHQRQALDAEED